MEDTNQVVLDHFIVVGGMAWGKDKELSVALTNWIKHERPRGDTTVHIRMVNADAYVDGMGTLYAHKSSRKLPDLKVPAWLIKKLDDVAEDLAELLGPIEDAAYE